MDPANGSVPRGEVGLDRLLFRLLTVNSLIQSLPGPFPVPATFAVLAPGLVRRYLASFFQPAAAGFSKITGTLQHA